VPACGAGRTRRVLAESAVAFSNEQHRRRYAEDRKHREEKLAANRAYRAAHRDRLNAERRDKWRSDAALRARHGAARLDRNYGLSRNEHRRLLDEQNGVCAVCKLPSRRALCVDHCHATRQVRGLLCDKCNTALGLLGDDVRRMLAAVVYLNRIGVSPKVSAAGLLELLASLIGKPPRAARSRAQARRGCATRSQR
jgi:recombination endonuclease VII